jgi:hypothetical protein|tara:strand:- start:1308 stop:1478 length:171 start_codon:yes stop_codon:yes gene_type:complete
MIHKKLKSIELIKKYNNINRDKDNETLREWDEYNDNLDQEEERDIEVFGYEYVMGL